MSDGLVMFAAGLVTGIAVALVGGALFAAWVLNGVDTPDDKRSDY